MSKDLAQEAVDAWVVILGDSGPLCMYALEAIRTIPPKKFADAINRINHAETIGPIVDPSAWLGDKFDRSAKWTAVLEKLHELAVCLETNDGNHG